MAIEVYNSDLSVNILYFKIMTSYDLRVRGYTSFNITPYKKSAR